MDEKGYTCTPNIPQTPSYLALFTFDVSQHHTYQPVHHEVVLMT